MKTKLETLLVITAIILFGSVIPARAQTMTMNMHQPSVFKSTAAHELRVNLRVLWEDHAMYTRNVILNIIDDLPGTNEAVGRLLRNQDDIGNAIKPVYGEAAGKKLSELLREHIVIAADLLKAAKVNNQAEFSKVNANWSRNGDDIAAFLHAANPKYWPLNEMKKMMQDHLSLTISEAVARIKKDYKADIEAYDKTRAELLQMSDMLAAGIVQQFPEKFK